MRNNMVEKIKALWIKYEEIIAYLIVGGLTTVVSWAAKFLANFLLFDNTMYPTPFQNVVRYQLDGGCHFRIFYQP